MIYLIYLTIALFSARVIFKKVVEVIAWDEKEPDGEDIAMSMVATCILSILWPIVFAGYFLYQLWIKPDWNRKQDGQTKH